MKSIAVIPARISSTRLKEKPLIKLGGKPLIQLVWERACLLNSIEEVVVATDSKKIQRIVEDFGGKCILSPDDLKSGSDRVYYVVSRFYNDAELIVNIQSDEPFLDTDFLDFLISQAKEGDAGLYTAYFPISDHEAQNRSYVKVVLNKNGEALYFSRNPIPAGAHDYKKHIGIYIWRRDALAMFHDSVQMPLELIENLEQLRVLENGGKIKVLESPKDFISIDTPEDLEMANIRLNED
ncbi:3-deoxy-manno-octulosonate cytidylyltransferase [Elusimicrobiota bacterium]